MIWLAGLLGDTQVVALVKLMALARSYGVYLRIRNAVVWSLGMQVHGSIYATRGIFNRRYICRLISTHAHAASGQARHFLQYMLKISLVPLVCSFVLVCLHDGNT